MSEDNGDYIVGEHRKTAWYWYETLKHAEDEVYAAAVNALKGGSTSSFEKAKQSYFAALSEAEAFGDRTGAFRPEYDDIMHPEISPQEFVGETWVSRLLSRDLNDADDEDECEDDGSALMFESFPEANAIASAIASAGGKQVSLEREPTGWRVRYAGFAGQLDPEEWHRINQG